MTAVYIAAGAVVLMVVMLAAVAVMIVLDTFVAWPPRPRHRRSPGGQYWTRSLQTTTAAIAVGRWTR